MNDTRLERLLDDVLVDIAALPVPDRLAPDIALATSRVRQRPRWLATIKEPPMRLPSGVVVGSPTLRLASIVLMVALALLALTGAFVAGASLLPSPAVLTIGRNGLIAYDQQGDIWVVDADGSHPRAIVTDETIDIDPTWSPDGTHLAFWAITDPRADRSAPITLDTIAAAIGGSTADLVVVAADGSDPHVAVAGVTMDPGGVPPSWHPDGHWLAYSYVTPDGVTTVARVAVGERAVDIGPGHAPTWAHHVAGGPAASGMDPAGAVPTPSLLAYGGPVGEEGVLLGVEPYLTGKVRTMRGIPDPGRLTQAPGSGAAFSLTSWSPDDSRLAYFAGDDGGGHDIWVVSADGNGERRIVASPGDDAWPAWSPDGSVIAFQHAVGGLADWRIGVTDPMGSATRTIEGLPILAGAPMTWSPDGQRLIGFGPSADGQRATTMMLFDAVGTAAPVVVEVDSPFWSSSWQRP